MIMLTFIIAASAISQAGSAKRMADITTEAEQRRFTPRIKYNDVELDKQSRLAQPRLARMKLHLTNISDIAITITSFYLETGIPLDSELFSLRESRKNKQCFRWAAVAMRKQVLMWKGIAWARKTLSIIKKRFCKVPIMSDVSLQPEDKYFEPGNLSYYVMGRQMQLPVTIKTSEVMTVGYNILDISNIFNIRNHVRQQDCSDQKEEIFQGSLKFYKNSNVQVLRFRPVCKDSFGKEHKFSFWIQIDSVEVNDVITNHMVGFQDKEHRLIITLHNEPGEGCCSPEDIKIRAIRNRQKG